MVSYNSNSSDTVSPPKDFLGSCEIDLEFKKKKRMLRFQPCTLGYQQSNRQIGIASREITGQLQVG